MRNIETKFEQLKNDFFTHTHCKCGRILEMFDWHAKYDQKDARLLFCFYCLEGDIQFLDGKIYRIKKEG